MSPFPPDMGDRRPHLYDGVDECGVARARPSLRTIAHHTTVTERTQPLSIEHILHTLEGDVDVLDPRPEQFHLSAISRALSRIPRWCGHTPLAISVAQHSLLVSEIIASPLHYELPELDGERESDLLHVPAKKLQLIALLHDAAEAYIGDIPSPVKNLPAIAPIRLLEALLLENIFIKFEIPFAGANAWSLPASVKMADAAALKIERMLLFDLTVHGDASASLAAREALLSGNWFRSVVETFSLSQPDARDRFEAMVSTLSRSDDKGETGA